MKRKRAHLDSPSNPVVVLPPPKRRRLSPSSSLSPLSSSVFQSKRFAISGLESLETRQRLREAICSSGGTVVPPISSLPSSSTFDYFVHSYNVETEDSDGLRSARETFSATVVPSSFVFHCVESNRLLSYLHFAFSYASRPLARCRPVPVSLDAEFRPFSPPRANTRELEENPQPFDEFLVMDRRVVSPAKKTIYIVLIGTSTQLQRLQSHYISPLLRFLRIYFRGLSVVLGPPPTSLAIMTDPSNPRSRGLTDSQSFFPIPTDTTNRFDVMSILRVLLEKRPSDAFCILGITLQSLYEDPSDPCHLYGRSTGDGVSCVSLSSISHLNLTLWLRSRVTVTMFGTVCHEICHMLGLDHCGFFRCSMNAFVEADGTRSEGSDDSIIVLDEEIEEEEEEEEEDSGVMMSDHGLFLCPIDLRKLEVVVSESESGQSTLIMWRERRYEHLSEWCIEKEWKQEQLWLDQFQ